MSDIYFEQNGSLGSIILDRPKALNALTHDMVRKMDAQLIAWAEDSNICAVSIEGAGEKGFCAGGDVIALYNSGKAWKAGDEEDPHWRQFFHDEYQLNSRIHHYEKPYIALMDGITMGGGVGVSVHGSHRVATERTMLAMPETGIGLVPDVGGGYFLPRLKGKMGMYLGLKGERLRAADCYYLDICQTVVSSASQTDIKAALSSEDRLDRARVTRILRDFHQQPDVSALAEWQGRIDDIFSAETVDAIFAQLQASEDDWSANQLKILGRLSPSSLKIAFEQIKRGGNLDFNEVMKMEFRLVNRIMAGNDFYEGVRALLIDKDNRPQWDPAHLNDIKDADIDGYFQSLGVQELTF